MLIDMSMQNSSNPYDFIMEVDHNKKHKRFSTGSSPKSKLLFYLAIVLGLLLTYVVVSRVFLSNGDTAKALKNVRAQQIEILRIAEFGASESKSSSVKSLSQTVISSVSSQTNEISEIMTNAKIKVTAKELALREDDKFEEQKDSAIKTGKFDDFIAQEIRQTLQVYLNDLSTAYDQVKTDISKTALKNAFDSTSSILK